MRKETHIPTPENDPLIRTIKAADPTLKEEISDDWSKTPDGERVYKNILDRQGEPPAPGVFRRFLRLVGIDRSSLTKD